MERSSERSIRPDPTLDEIATVIDLVDRSGMTPHHDIPAWQYRLFVRLANEIATSEGTEAALTSTLEVLCREAGWALGQAWVPDPSEQFLVSKAFFCTAPVLASFAETAEGIRLPFGVGVPGTVWATGLPAWVQDVQGNLSPIRSHAAIRSGLRAAGAFPITSDRRLIAVAEFFFLEARDDDRLALLRAAAVGADLGPLIEARASVAGAPG